MNSEEESIELRGINITTPPQLVFLNLSYKEVRLELRRLDIDTNRSSISKTLSEILKDLPRFEKSPRSSFQKDLQRYWEIFRQAHNERNPKSKRIDDYSYNPVAVAILVDEAFFLQRIIALKRYNISL